jgi:hypothetical protein
VLVFELLLDTTVEEEGDVRVLFGFYGDEESDVKSFVERGGDLPATWHCLTPCLASHSAKTLVILVGGKAIEKGNSALYRVMVVMCCK